MALPICSNVFILFICTQRHQICSRFLISIQTFKTSVSRLKDHFPAVSSETVLSNIAVTGLHTLLSAILCQIKYFKLSNSTAGLILLQEIIKVKQYL